MLHRDVGLETLVASVAGLAPAGAGSWPKNRGSSAQPPTRAAYLTAGLAAGRFGDWHAGTQPRAALGQSGGAHAHMPELGVAKLPVASAMDQPLVEPEMRRSVNGVLSTTLRVAYAYRSIGGVKLYVRSYEGGSPGPTCGVQPGDTLRIKLVNDLPPNRDSLPPQTPSASVQQHQFPFPRRACEPERHCRQRHALDGAWP